MKQEIGFVTDSTSDIPLEEAAKYEIDIVPANIIFSGKSLRDGVDISRSELYRRMATERLLPTTSSPSAGVFEETFESMLTRGFQKILSIHPASNLSGIFNAARLAASHFPGRVEVLESGSVSMGTGFQLLAATKAATQGASMEAIRNLIADTRKRVHLVALLQSLTNLAHSGRVPMVLAGIGNFLQIKLLISIVEGTVNRVAQVRTHSRGVAVLLEQVRSWGPIESLAVAHANARSAADALVPQISQNLQEVNRMLQKKIFMIEISPAVGIHTGPGALGVIAVSAAKH
jgi:DegV family protein with EDD domain